jgi:hypothetical protein
VGQALQKLAEKGTIRLVRKGVGSAPNIYRGKVQDKVQDQEAPIEAPKEQSEAINEGEEQKIMAP